MISQPVSSSVTRGPGVCGNSAMTCLMRVAPHTMGHTMAVIVPALHVLSWKPFPAPPFSVGGSGVLAHPTGGPFQHWGSHR